MSVISKKLYKNTFKLNTVRF